MRTRVQLATKALGPQLLDLLTFPGHPVASDSVKCSGRWYGTGKTNRFRNKAREEVAAGLRNRLFNLAQIDFRVDGFAVQEELSLSPLNSQWSSCGGYFAKTRSDEDMRMSLQSWETSEKWTMCGTPSLLDCWIESERDFTLTESVDLIAKSIQTAACPRILIGCADFDRTGLENMRDALAPWPGSYRYLGERFDALHPILFGPVETCIRLQSALSGRGLYREIGFEGNILGILGIPDSVMNEFKDRRVPDPWPVSHPTVVTPNREVDRELLSCLVPRDETTAHKERVPDPAKGEAILAPGETRWLYLPPRYRELMEAGLLPSVEGYGYTPVLSRRMISLLGFDPEAVFGWVVQAPIAEQTEALIDEAFEELPSSMPLRERILEAHSMGYRKWYPPGMGHEQLMEFIKRHYFRLA